MGIPFWKPKEKKSTKTNRHDRTNTNIRQRLRRPIRLRTRDNLPDSFSNTLPLLSQPYIYPPPTTTTASSSSSSSSPSSNSLTSIPSFLPTDEPTTSSPFSPFSAPMNLATLRRRRMLNIHTSIHSRRAEIESRIHQRYLEKEELLNQLEITTSLLDQFISIRQISGEDLALPNFIAEDLTTILSATSINMEDTTLTTASSSSNHDNDNNNNNINYHNYNNHNRNALLPSISLPRTSSLSSIALNRSSIIESDTDQHRHPLTTIPPSYTSSSSQSIDELVDVVMSNPPHSSRLAELDESIANAHHRVTDQLEVLGW